MFATRRWLAVFAGSVAFVLACLELGSWQWGRHVERTQRAEAVEANYAAPPVPLGSVLARPEGDLPPDRAWTQVVVTGRYAASEQLLVRGRTLHGELGLEVLVPLRVGSAVLLVDRGWVAAPDTAEQRPQVPAVPPGEITVTGWLRPGEESRDRDLPAGQLASVNLDEARPQVTGPLYGGYVVLGQERDAEGREPTRPAALAPPDTDVGPHQAYAIQWWLTSLLAPVFVVLMARRERDALRASGPAARVEVRPARPRKVRIWDEEDG